ncbi:MAG: pilus assembly protein [Deltaproteobacteria bacterium]|nr:pilus assembly protein [Deltaproteobacteria bacterium]
MKSLKNNQKGTTAVELALVLPVLLTLIFGMIELSLFFFNKHILANAAGEGARAGSIIRAVEKDGSIVSSDEDKRIKDKVKLYAKGHLVTFDNEVFDDDNIAIFPPAPDRDTFFFGDDLEVKVEYEYKFLYLDPLLGPITIKASANMRME